MSMKRIGMWTAGALFLAWNAVTAVDGAHLVRQLNEDNKFESALALRLAEDFRSSSLGEKMNGSGIGKAAINITEGTLAAAGAPGLIAGHTAGLLLFDK